MDWLSGCVHVLLLNYIPFKICKMLKVFELHFTLLERIFIAHVRQTYSGTVRALPDASYMLVAAFAVSSVDIFLAAWVDMAVQAGTREFVV